MQQNMLTAGQDWDVFMLQGGPLVMGQGRFGPLASVLLQEALDLRATFSGTATCLQGQQTTDPP